ncbi:unnamed protein product, partial [Didymodactylos carnosus]
MHAKTHCKIEGNDSFLIKCTMCDYTTQTQSDLEEHMNKHRGSRPFQCSECGLTYSTQGDLRQHTTKVHHCGDSSDVAGAGLSTHQSFHCVVCSKTFTNLHTLEQHMISIHQIENGDDRYSTIGSLLSIFCCPLI